jgi:hypothetical protein
VRQRLTITFLANQPRTACTPGCSHVRPLALFPLRFSRRLLGVHQIRHDCSHAPMQIEESEVIGTLPAAWSQSQTRSIQLNGNAALAGPAFPPSWIAPGALAALQIYSVARTQLDGMLPANLSWPSLHLL